MLEISTAAEVQNFAHKMTAGKPKIEKRAGSIAGTPSRQSTNVPGTALAPPECLWPRGQRQRALQGGPQGEKDGN